MKNILGFGVVVALFLSGCQPRHSSHGEQSYHFADSVQVDSLTLWVEREGSNKQTDTAYVLDTAAPLYTLRGGRLYLDTVLPLATMLEVTKDDFGRYFTHQFYPVSWQGRLGYMRGTSLGYGLQSDFDNDGRPDLILYGYERYVRDTLTEVPVNPLLVRFVSAAGALADLRDTVASDMDLTEVGHVRLSDHVHVYELNAGYPACGYPQWHLILAYGNGKAEVIHRSVTSTDSGYGDYCEFYYPSDTTGRADTIYISHRLAAPLSEESDSIVAHTTDSTILYLHKGSWGAKNYRLDPASN
ncbi:MAG: hypothetical protein JST83_04770 [Bacteroidetes bacterium]|nr:hypothetical protein [Bacteroidota bacterium]